MQGERQRAYCAGLVSSCIRPSDKPKLRMAALIERMVDNSFALKLCGIDSMGIATVAVLLIMCFILFFGFLYLIRVR